MSDNSRIFQIDDLDALFWPPSRIGVESAWYSHVPFAHWLVSQIQPRLLVELGTHNGVSYSAFCEAVVRKRLPTVCFAVDTWTGDVHAGYYGEDVYVDLSIFNDTHYASFSQLLRCTFDEALPRFKDCSIDLLHIDAIHTYQAGRHDFETWLPKLSDRAVVLFHDTNVRERDFGIWKLFSELKQQYPTFEFLHGHGLGVVATGGDVPAVVAALCSLDNGSIEAVRERFASIGVPWAAEGRQVDQHHTSSGTAQNIGAMEPGRRDEHARNDCTMVSMDSLKAALLRLNTVEAKLGEASERANSFMTEIESLRTKLMKLDVIEAKLQAGSVRADTLTESIESIRGELCDLSNFIGPRFERFLGKITSWAYFDEAYNVWKLYKKRSISRADALREIDERFGIWPFFVLLPFFKIARPFRKRKVPISLRPGGNNNHAPIEFDAEWYLKLYPDVKESGMDPLQHYIEFGRAEGRFGSPRIGIEVGPAFDRSKKTIFLISHDASQTGAPILAFNLLEKLAPRYNVVTILLGRGALENAFKNASAAIVGLFLDQMRYTSFVHAPLLNVCNRLAPAFAIVNSMESREALIPLAEAKVPSVLLVHEFCSLCQGLDMGRVVAHADQMVFPARRVWEDAVGVFPELVAYPTNIVTQGQSRIPREWLGGETADDEEKRIAAVMRPDGQDDGAVVVIGCGYFDVRKGIDLFISTAASLRQRSPSRRFRFVWVGRTSEDLYAAYIATQVKCSGLQETVEFLGEVNSLDPVYAMADIFLLSSRLDPFPNVAIDAMLAGLPLVCFNGASGVAEMLSSQADLKHLVVPYVDTNSAAEVIERLGDDEAYLQRTRDAIRKLALSSFDMDHYVERLEQLAEDASHR